MQGAKKGKNKNSTLPYGASRTNQTGFCRSLRPALRFLAPLHPCVKTAAQRAVGP